MRAPTIAALAAGLVLAACGDTSDTEAELHEARVVNSYLEALCRVYEESDCQENMSESCEGAISFAEGDCEPFFRLALSGCDGYREALVEHETSVDACVEQLETFDCAGDEGVCVEDGPDLFVAGPCGEVDDAIQASCPEDTAAGF